MQRRRRCGLLPATCRGADKGGVSLFQKEIPLPYTLPEKICIASVRLEELRRLPIATCCARRSRVERCHTTCLCSYYPLLRSRWRLCALRMRHTPCGCRSAHLVEVQTNLLLPTMHTVSIMRTAASEAMPHSASCLPPSKRHSRLTTVRRGCCQVATRRDSWRSHVHRTRLRSACSHSSYKLPMPGVEGPSPRLSLGDSKGVFSSEREYPLWCRGAHAALPPALTREKVQSFRAILPSARRAESTCAPAGAKKEHPYGCSFSNR